MSAYWFRIEDYGVAGGVDECGDPIPGSGYQDVRLRELRVVKETPCGAWLEEHNFWTVTDDGERIPPPTRWVKRDATRRYACPTIDEALESFKARKCRQAKILRAQAARADEAAERADRYAKERWASKSQVAA